LEALYWNPQFSDVSFVVEGERFRAHKLVLATRCEYFRQGNASSYYLMIRYSYGIRLIFTAQSHALWRTERKLQSRNSAQGNKHPRLPHFAEVSMVLYIYTGRVELTAFNFEQLLAILHLAHEYGLIDIQRPIVDYLKVIVTFD
uniref:BTB domain-containing protein n=1 Tax=Heligmosomoides polygyrus TaxID=6339 RepID=A0A183FWN0_HELPZ